MIAIRSAVVVAMLLAPGTVLPAWERLDSSAGPEPRRAHATAFHEAEGALLVFSGIADPLGNTLRDDTWSWTGGVWTEHSGSPAPRIGPAAVYDADRRRVVLFGGLAPAEPEPYPTDTWEWDGTVWAFVVRPNSPPGRFGHTLAYDTARARTVLYGGFQGATRLEDLWEWDGSSWTEVPRNSPWPGLVIGAASAYDVTTERVMLFGGNDAAGDPTADHWAWDGSRWELLGQGPYAAFSAALVGTSQGLLLFGGDMDGSLVGDTWLWTSSSGWVQATGAGPPPRSLSGLAYDASTNRALLFGGADESDDFDDLWSFELPNGGGDAGPGGCGCASSRGFPATGTSLWMLVPLLLRRRRTNRPSNH